MNFRMRHSHGRNFCPIVFKFWSDVAMGNPVFAIENQQNRSITFGFTKNRAYDFLRFSPKIAAKIKIVRYLQVRCHFRLRPKKKNSLFPVTRPSQKKHADSTKFFSISKKLQTLQCFASLCCLSVPLTGLNLTRKTHHHPTKSMLLLLFARNLQFIDDTTGKNNCKVVP